MNEYNVTLNTIELIAGTTNRTSPLYIEAVNDIGGSNNKKAVGYFQNFITSIETIASKEGVEDPRISSSQGNIQSFSGYENIKTAIAFLSKSLQGSTTVNDLADILGSLEVYQAQYTSGYEQHIRLITLEYESAVYMLVTGLSFLMANNINVVSTGNRVVVTKKAGNDKGVISKTVNQLARELKSSNHKDYLSSLLNVKNNLPVDEEIRPVQESVLSDITDSVDLISSIFNGVGRVGSFIIGTLTRLYKSLFGIIPLIRTIIYLRYKKKADTILALEEQVYFIQMNIDQLKNIKNMDETKKAEVIKKQEAYIEAYRKKAEKLRAELVETEKETAVAINQNNVDLKKIPDGYSLD